MACYQVSDTSVNTLLQQPYSTRESQGPEGSFRVIWDSGASMCILPCKDDFVKMKNIETNVDGVSEKLSIKGVGKVKWSMTDIHGKLRHLTLDCYYAPNAASRLLSTSVFCKTYPKNSIEVNSTGWVIKGNPNDSSESTLEVYINPFSNLPTTTCYDEKALRDSGAYFTQGMSSTHRHNYNLSEPHKELIRWHN